MKYLHFNDVILQVIVSRQDAWAPTVCRQRFRVLYYLDRIIRISAEISLASALEQVLYFELHKGNDVERRDGVKVRVIGDN